MSKRPHPEVPAPLEVTDETRESLREWARDLTGSAQEVVLEVHEGESFAQISLQVDRNDPETFLISCHEPSTDYTVRHTFLNVHPGTVDMGETVSVNPEAGETPEQKQVIKEATEEQDVLTEDLAPIANQEERAKQVLALLPKGHISHRK